MKEEKNSIPSPGEGAVIVEKPVSAEIAHT